LDRCGFETGKVQSGAGWPVGRVGVGAGQEWARFLKFMQVQGRFKLCGAGADKKLTRTGV